MKRGQEEPAVRLEGVSRKYGAVTALKDVSLDIRAGEMVGLLGRNGAGKTTLLNLITGYLPPTAGRIRVDGMDMLENPRECKRRIGYAPEQPPLYDEMTVEGYLSFVCDLREVARQGKAAHIQEILAICSLEEMGRRLIGHLSKGYRQRVGIAQVLCGSPDVLIFDEPTVGLDPVQVVEIRQLLRRLGGEHTVLFSSHILSEVQQICSSVLILQAGKLVKSFDLHEQNGAASCLELSVAATEEEILPALRSLPFIRRMEKLPSKEEGTVRLQLTCGRAGEPGLITDRIFHLCAARDLPIREMFPVRDDLESTFIRAIQQ